MNIRVDRVFDPMAAQALLRRIAALPAGTAVVVDLTGVVEFHDSALAFLAQALEWKTVTIRGMGLHHLRLLRYLGATNASSRRQRAG